MTLHPFPMPDALVGICAYSNSARHVIGCSIVVDRGVLVLGDRVLAGYALDDWVVAALGARVVAALGAGWLRPWAPGLCRSAHNQTPLFGRAEHSTNA